MLYIYLNNVYYKYLAYQNTHEKWTAVPVALRTALLRLVEVLPDGQVGSLAALAQLHVAGGLKVKSHLEDLEDPEIYGLYMVCIWFVYGLWWFIWILYDGLCTRLLKLLYYPIYWRSSSNWESLFSNQNGMRMWFMCGLYEYYMMVYIWLIIWFVWYMNYIWIYMMDMTYLENVTKTQKGAVK